MQLFNLQIGGTLPQDLQQGAEEKWLCFTSTNWVYTIYPAPAVFTVQMIVYYSILIVYYCYNRLDFLYCYDYFSFNFYV